MKIGILGHGIVGSGVSRIIGENNYEDLKIVAILVRDEKKMLDERFTLDYETILNNEEIDTIVECMGGDEPAYTFVRKALLKGKNVVSANKKMLASHLDLFDIAEENNVSLLIEASCGGGIPWFANIRRIEKSDQISSFRGIMNGTTNYLLSRLFNEDIGFEDVLKDAQRLGYAEKDPGDDLSGRDVLYKTILSIYQLFGARIRPEEIYCYGIENIDQKDIAYAKENNVVIKLISQAGIEDDKLKACVMPHLLKKDDLFANTGMNFNILECESQYLGKASFYGQGAGSLPTGHAIVQDLLELKDGTYQKKITERKMELSDVEGRFYIRNKDIDKLDDLIELGIDDEMIITRNCLLKDIVNKIDVEKGFIAEVEDD